MVRLRVGQAQVQTKWVRRIDRKSVRMRLMRIEKSRKVRGKTLKRIRVSKTRVLLLGG